MIRAMTIAKFKILRKDLFSTARSWKYDFLQLIESLPDERIESGSVF